MTRQLALEKAFTHDYLNELSAEEASAGITGARWKENFTESTAEATSAESKAGVKMMHEVRNSWADVGKDNS